MLHARSLAARLCRSPEALAKGNTRPCDFCGYPVKTGSIDEYDCPVCGEPLETDLADGQR